MEKKADARKFDRLSRLLVEMENDIVKPLGQGQVMDMRILYNTNGQPTPYDTNGHTSIVSISVTVPT